jgi:hypothetical protein
MFSAASHWQVQDLLGLVLFDCHFFLFVLLLNIVTDGLIGLYLQTVVLVEYIPIALSELDVLSHHIESLRVKEAVVDSVLVNAWTLAYIPCPAHTAFSYHASDVNAGSIALSVVLAHSMSFSLQSTYIARSDLSCGIL